MRFTFFIISPFLGCLCYLIGMQTDRHTLCTNKSDYRYIDICQVPYFTVSKEKKVKQGLVYQVSNDLIKPNLRNGLGLNTK